METKGKGMNLLLILFHGFDRLVNLSNLFAMVSIGLMSLLIIVEVAARLFLNASTLISEEWSGYLLVYLGFLGLANAFKLNSFLTVEIIFDRLSHDVRKKLKICSMILAIIFLVILDYELITFVLSSYQKNLKSISYSETPLVIPQIAMPIGISLLSLQLLKELIGRVFFKGPKNVKEVG